MTKILLVYSTTDGHTIRICQRIQRVLEAQAHDVTLISVADCQSADLQRFDKIVIGASIRYGKHSPLVVDFVNGNRDLLDRKPNAFFSVNVVARKPEKSQPDTNPYVLKFLRQISWKPKQLAVFAGKIDYPKYGFVDRQIIRFIMWMTNGPTGRNDVVEFTDWQRVEEFGRLIGKM